MEETPFFFSASDSKLFGVLHAPARKSEAVAFLFCHPFGEEKLWSHLVYVNFARELADRGYPVLRFDYMGNGDSYGDFEESSVETNLRDIRAALEVLREKVGPSHRFGLVGLRFGATLAALFAEGEPEIKRLVLWEPIVDGSQYAQDLLRVNLTSQLAVYKEIRYTREALVKAMKQGETANVDGYELTREMYEQIIAINLLERPKQPETNALVVQMSKRGAGVKKELSLLQSRYPKGHVSIIKEEPFWKEIKSFYSRAPHLYESTLSWLKRCDDEV